MQAALMCLALNIYHESRGEPIDGQIAVAMVTMNRADWQPSEVCRVVYEKNQFSWTNSNKNKTQEPIAWARAKRIAKRVVDRKHHDITYGATHFHSHTLHPAWRKTLKKTTMIGQHVFYTNN
ncbi:cell wall hydrolase [Pseudomonas fluorescens]|nr:cell wall hydrolase [Pseudomonas fluorescens]